MVAQTEQQEAQIVRVIHSPAVIARAKYLYLTKSLQPRDIAQQLGLEPATVHNWASLKGWAKTRKERAEALDQKITRETEKQDDELMLSLAPQTQELAEDTLTFARETLDARDAKGLALTSQALKNFVSVYRTAKGLDASQAGPQITFNAFYSPTAPKASQAEPSIDVTTTPAE